MDVEVENMQHSEGTRVEIVHQKRGVSKIQTQQTLDGGFLGTFLIPLHDAFPLKSCDGLFILRLELGFLVDYKHMMYTHIYVYICKYTDIYMCTHKFAECVNDRECVCMCMCIMDFSMDMCVEEEHILSYLHLTELRQPPFRAVTSSPTGCTSLAEVHRWLCFPP